MVTTHDETTTESWPEATAALATEAAPADFRPGDVIDGRYLVRGLIGRGGMGSVVQVECLAEGKLLALKYSDPGAMKLKRFVREVCLMEKVRHAHVVPVLAANLEHYPPYFVMPLALGSLEQDLSRLEGKEEEALAVFRQICLGVQAIHDSGIIHRDLKPANVLRFAGGRIAVTDLGVAKLEARDTTVLTKTLAFVGTLAYVAPEQLMPSGSRDADARTDIYQLGKVLYRMLTGRSPVLIEPGALPPGLAHILQRATASNPRNRYQDLGEFLDALRYYELAKDPDRNSREALENLILQAEDRLRRREYDRENLRAILGVMVSLERRELSAVLASFDRLPDALLPVLAADFPDEFLPLLRAYAEAIRARVARSNFGYADKVARRMRAVFLHARPAELKTVALRTMLIAAVELNRFAAMGVFNRLLMDVRSTELALPVAEMLRAHADYYHEVAQGAPPDRLHPAIRDIQKEVLTWSDLTF